MKILVLSLKRLGDVILTTPAVRRLAQALPDAQIDFLVYPEFASVLEGNPYIRNVLIYPKRKPWRLPALVRRERYDWVIDFLNTGASSWACFLSGSDRRLAFINPHPRFIHNIQISHPQIGMYSALKKLMLADYVIAQEIGKEKCEVRGARCEDAAWKPEIFVEKARLDYWADVLNQIAPEHRGPIVMMSPVSRRESRRWRLEGFAEVARKLAEHDGALVLCLWGPGENQLAAEVVRLAHHSQVRPAPAFASLQDLAAFLSHAALVITNCNGTRHIAVARGVPTVTIHMSSDPVSWNPPNPTGSGFHPFHSVARVEKLWCISCQKNVCPYKLECSNLLSPDLVYYHAVELLQRNKDR